ncbi:hypothetical protein JWJ90_20510 [Desulfobulbus rhabdoformis]|uniref:hypothetical protein n=1 Tax=Desulfobulbus rhabdoformis TaxID=34032 RepID=UPI001963D2C4|nr:hypothetical protein [Desulfobulbus rhabdoformis]MBM9616653.1 hypothetical protein [Desulfobulbus rhabdoformis]
MCSTTVHAGWQSDITQNQIAASSYINQLRVNPMAQRPRLIEGQGWQSQNANAEIYAAMNTAEQLSRAGRPDLIQQPNFSFNAQERRQIRREVRREMNARGY